MPDRLDGPHAGAELQIDTPTDFGGPSGASATCSRFDLIAQGMGGILPSTGTGKPGVD